MCSNSKWLQALQQRTNRFCHKLAYSLMAVSIYFSLSSGIKGPLQKGIQL
jgi:hypothetical protein